jgi:hypothetical protein
VVTAKADGAVKLLAKRMAAVTMKTESAERDLTLMETPEIRANRSVSNHRGALALRKISRLRRTKPLPNTVFRK